VPLWIFGDVNAVPGQGTIRSFQQGCSNSYQTRLAATVGSLQDQRLTRCDGKIQAGKYPPFPSLASDIPALEHQASFPSSGNL
jgi:hypothetical protein